MGRSNYTTDPNTVCPIPDLLKMYLVWAHNETNSTLPYQKLNVTSEEAYKVVEKVGYHLCVELVFTYENLDEMKMAILRELNWPRLTNYVSVTFCKVPMISS